jgi:hypothetical protein
VDDAKVASCPCYPGRAPAGRGPACSVPGAKLRTPTTRGSARTAALASGSPVRSAVPRSTEHYTQITPTRLAQAYADAGYTIDVLIDREAVQTGAAATGTLWRYFDLGHGYCTYNFFEQCPHRMACARCDFYVPKASTRSQLPEAKASLQHMRMTIPLTEAEQAAVDHDADAVERLLTRLADGPTPAGPTPRQLLAPSGGPLLTTTPCRQSPGARHGDSTE